MKFMNLKRFASTAMAGVMALSLAVPALADDQQTVIEATYADIELSVTVPADTKAQINPYGLPVTMGDATTTISGQPITIASPLLITNESSVALKVAANVKSEVSNGFTLATAANGVADKNTKEAFVELQLFEAPGIDGATALDPTTTCPLYAALEDDDAVLKATLATTPATGVDASGSKDLVLREGADGLAQDGGAAFVRLSGVVAKKAAWEANDKLTATITYSFEPSTYTKSAGTVAASPATVAASATSTLTLTPALPTGVTVSAWKWVSADTSKVTVADVTTATCAATGVASGSSVITVSGVGSDGITYSAQVTVTVS